MFDPELMRVLGRVTAGVFEVAILVTLGVLAGTWADGQLGSSPVFIITLSLAGLIIGFRHLLLTLQHQSALDDREPPKPRD
jgi:F0F1-type ATP synthase assembly protein I